MTDDDRRRRRRARRALRRAQANRSADDASRVDATRSATPQTRSDAPQRRLSDVVGAVYVIGDDEYTLHAIRGGHVVLRKVGSYKAFIMEQSSGPLEVSRWRRRRG